MNVEALDYYALSLHLHTAYGMAKSLPNSFEIYSEAEQQQTSVWMTGKKTNVSIFLANVSKRNATSYNVCWASKDLHIYKGEKRNWNK